MIAILGLILIQQFGWEEDGGGGLNVHCDHSKIIRLFTLTSYDFSV